MKKRINILGSLLILAAMPFVYSCSDDVEYDAAKAPDGVQAYFSSEASSTIELSESETSFDVTVMRASTSGAVSFNLAVTDGSEGRFSIPTAVSFADGESQATLTIGYNPDDFEYDDFYEVTMTIPDEYSTPYGVASYTFSAGIPSAWTSLGWCSYTDDFFTTFYGVGNLTWEVEIEENAIKPGLFRLVYPYDEKYEWNDPGDWDESKTYYLEIDASDPDAVFITRQEIGVNWGYGMISVWSIADYDVQAGSTLEAEKAAGNCGTYANGVITFPTNTLLINMPEYSSGWYYANTAGAFKVVMPGVVLSDYSVSIAYSGKYTDANEANFAVANVTLGADVESARVALVEGNYSASALNALIAGSIDYTEITESGSVSFPCEESGTYTVIVVSYGGGEAQESDYATFKFTVGAADTWTSLGMCTYTDDVVASVFGYAEDCLTYEVEIQENDNQPGLYRLMYPYDGKYPYNDPGDWDTSKDYNIEINACDPDGVYITQQELGIDWGYGMMSVWSSADYYMANGYSFEDVKDAGVCGTLKDGVITFPQYELMVSMANYYSGSWMYGNYWGMFKVVLPGASGVKAQKVSSTHKSISKGVKRTKTLDAKKMVKKTAQPVK